MSRKIINATETLFDLIKLNFDLSATAVLPADFYSKRYIDGDAVETRWFSHSKIVNSVAISQELKFAILKFDGDNYFITVGLEDPDILPPGFVEEKVNAGLFATIISELEVPVRKEISNFYLEENILSQSAIDPLYKGHDKKDLAKVFPNIYAMKITSGFSGDPTNIFQVVSFHVTLNSKYIFLPYSRRTLDKFQELVACNSTILSYESIMQALFSSHFKFAFLDLYRCIELLYQLIYLDETHNKLSLTIDRTDFLIAIENDLGWKPKERDSLIKIFNDTPTAYITDINKAIRDAAPQNKNYGNWLYDLRCNIVHLKSIQKKFELKDSDWEKIIYGTSQVLCYWYNKYPNFT